MLFNRINHLFDQLNVTLNVQTYHKWKELYLNGTTNDSYPIGNMISELNSSELILQNIDGSGSALNFSQMSINKMMPFEPEPLAVLIVVTMCYSLIFIAGILGNVITCTVISRNKSMHTATNYYLFNLAISDLILLLSGERNFVCSCCCCCCFIHCFYDFKIIGNKKIISRNKLIIQKYNQNIY